MEDREKTPLIARQEHNTQRPLRQTIEWKYYMILPIVVVIFTGIGLEYYTSTQWIQHYVKVKMFQDAENDSAIEGCKAKNHSDPNYKTYEQVQTTSANWQLYKMLVGCVPSFILTLILPSYSDVFGRRFLFIVGLTGMFIQFAIESAAIYFELELYYFISGSAINGFFGGFYSILSAIYSYIADVTKGGGRRTLGFSAFDGLLLACITLSGLGCGYIITYAGFFIPLAAGTILTFIALLLTVFFLPETHDKKNRATSVNICKIFSRTIDFYKSSAFKGRRLAYILLLLAFFFEEVTSSQRSSIEMIFQLGMPLCWTAEKVGIFTALRHAAQSLASTVLIVPLKACFSELTIAIWSALFNAGSYVMEGIAQTDLTMYLVSVPATLSFLTVPMIKSIMSMMTPADKQGSLFASVSAAQSLCGLVALFVTNTTYAATVSFLNGFVFLELAGICMIVVLLLCAFRFTQKSVFESTAIEKKIVVQA